MSDVLRGQPSSGSTLSTNTAPRGGFLGNVLFGAQGIQGQQQATGQGILSGLINPSGA